MLLTPRVNITPRFATEGLWLQFSDCDGVNIGGHMLAWDDLRWAMEDSVFEKYHDDEMSEGAVQSFIDHVEGRFASIIDKADETLTTEVGKRD